MLGELVHIGIIVFVIGVVAFVIYGLVIRVPADRDVTRAPRPTRRNGPSISRQP